MGTVKKTLGALLCAACLFSSCSLFEAEIPLRDLGFEIGSEVVWNAEYMAYTLRLTLLEGEDGDCTFSYLIDDDPLVRLGSTSGGSVESGKDVALSSKGALVFILPSLAAGEEHSIRLEFTREGVSRSYTVALPDTSQNGIGVRIDTGTSLDFSRVILTNRMGASVTTYNVAFYLDGELLSGMKYMSNTFGGSMDIDFARSESYTFEMPYLVAGEHILKVDVRSSQGSESTRTAFTEPQRRQTALTFSYNPFTGRLMLESAYNPLKTVFDITVDITVNGSVTARHPLFFGIADPETETFSVTGEATARITPEITAAQIDGGKLKALMDEVYSNTRTDAANAIGNGNKHLVHADITSVSLSLTIHSLGDYAGKTVVTIDPANGSAFPIQYTYAESTWTRDKGAVQTIRPTFTVNGVLPSAIRVL